LVANGCPDCPDCPHCPDVLSNRSAIVEPHIGGSDGCTHGGAHLVAVQRSHGCPHWRTDGVANWGSQFGANDVGPDSVADTKSNRDADRESDRG
jgi:hypothetical protein